MVCPSCGSNKIEYDHSNGTTFCVECGAVSEENAIVSEVTFGESSSGAAILQGTLVSSDSGRINVSGHYGKRNALQSRERTLTNGKRAIHMLGSALKMPERYQEAAQRYFNLAVNCNFNKGRPTLNVAAVCLYIVCRQEKSGFMLMDFSELMETNVFLLGITFAKLVRELNLVVPMVDPSLYITRFAMMLEFGDKTQRVVTDALRLVQRMDRDWIQTGRRPAGICGACLLIAARMHNFRRTYSEVIRVVKVASVTIRERLKEFKHTPTGGLSLTDFRTVWLEESTDPPAFARNRKRDRRGSFDGNIKLPHKEPRLDGPEALTDGHHPTPPDSLPEKSSDRTSVPRNATAAMDEDVDPYGWHELTPQLNATDQLLVDEINKYITNERVKLFTQQIQNQEFSEDISTWEDFDDDEIMLAILTEPEVAHKTEVWTRNNADYLQEQEIKAKIQASRGRSAPSTRKKRNKPGASKGGAGGGPGTSASAVEAAKNLLTAKKLSKKINYAVLENLFEPQSPSTVASSPHPLTPAMADDISSLAHKAKATEASDAPNDDGDGGGEEDVGEEEYDDLVHPMADDLYGDAYDDFNEYD
ncbi:transcription factor TFIIIB subunit brf1 [Dimargaris verticillata]|uniref:B-related factor 1 n=1 Tax=Dimargaris verticillata TaxID=2761393 RepID=A0A9W8BA44_9FUNG|nr:transcription factor TFIIIB subunit brf1 [Dimargaris verticillata]